MGNHSDKFTNDFSKNKETLKKLIDTDSKKLTNIVSGYITRIVKKENIPRKIRYGTDDDKEY